MYSWSYTSSDAEVSIDGSAWPIVTIKTVGTMTDAEYLQFEAALDGLLLVPARRALIFDARQTGSMTAFQRRKNAEWSKTHRDELGRKVLGAAFVFSNAVVRGFLTAVFWLSPPPYPYVVVKTVEEALVFCQAKVAGEAAS